MKFPSSICIVLLFIYHCLVAVTSENIYSKQANEKFNSNQSVDQLKLLDKPFRMGKLNLLWKKAQVRLSEPKLKSFYNEMKVHDKEEINFKKIKSDGLDFDGQKEGALRRKLVGIMSTYGLLEHFEAIHDGESPKLETNENSRIYTSKATFKDKKLNKLWEKAEHSGFTTVELLALKEEFSHHQDKLDEYYSLLGDVGTRGDDSLNSVDFNLDILNKLEGSDTYESKKNDHFEKADMLRHIHQEVKQGYDRLHKLSLSGPTDLEFVEPKVQMLWKMATNGNFSESELESVRLELHHYEKRLLKLRHLQAEAALDSNSIKKLVGEKMENDVNDVIKKQQRKVEKYHEHLHSKITGGKHHFEL